MPYEVICSNYNDKKYYDCLYGFYEAHCNKCNSLKFGLRKYKWISKQDYEELIKCQN